MEKKTRFGDLKVGDIVFVANQKEWTLRPIKIVGVSDLISTVWIYLESGSNFSVNKTKSYYELLLSGVWVNYGEAIKEMMKRAKEQEKVYIENIDALISKYDALQKFIMEHGKEV